MPTFFTVERFSGTRIEYLVYSSGDGVCLPTSQRTQRDGIYSAPPSSFRLPPQLEPVNSPATPPLLSVEHLDRRYSLHRCSQGPTTPDHSLRRVHFTVSVSLVM